MKKSVALLITLCMVLSLIPLGMVSAEATITVTASVADGATVFVGDKIELTFSEAIDEEKLTGITAGDEMITPTFKAETDNKVVEIVVPETAGALAITVSAEVGNETNTIAEETTFTYNVVNLLFDMDIAGVDGETVNQTTTTVRATSATQKYLMNDPADTTGNTKYPVLATSWNAANYADYPEFHNEDNIKYLTFARDVYKSGTLNEGVTNVDGTDDNYAWSNTRSRLVVRMDPDLEIGNKDALTFETWVRPRYDARVKTATGAYNADSDINRIFSFGTTRGTEPEMINHSSGFKYLFEFDWMLRNTSSGGPRFDVDEISTNSSKPQLSFYSVNATNEPANGYLTEFVDKWTHVVLTREWTEVTAPVYDEDGNVTTAATGTWTTKLYLNGAYRGSKTSSEVNREDVTTVANPSAASDYGTDDGKYTTKPCNQLIIGSSAAGGLTGAFRGDISTFKMYDGTLAYDSIRQNFEDTRDDYYPTNGRKVFGMDINDDGSGITATSDSTSAGIMLDATSGGYSLPTRMVEDDVEFLRFATLNETSNEFENVTSQVAVRLNDYEIADEESITVEAWVRPDYSLNTTKSGTTDFSGRMSLFSVGRHPKYSNTISGSTAVKDAYRVQFEDAKTDDTVTSYGTMVFSNKTDRGEKATLADLSAHDGQWHHYVITRTWTSKPTDDYPDNGTWSHKLYVDGKLYAEGSVNANVRYDYSQLAYEGRNDANTSEYLAIGGTTGSLGNPAFHGDIAEFSLYAGELSADTIWSKYVESPSALTGLKDFNFVDGDNNILTNNTISGAAQIGVIGSVELTEAVTSPFVMLAVYTGESGDVLHSCIKLDATVTDGTLTVSEDAITGLTDKNITYAKLFVWEGAGSIRPLLDAYCL